VADPEPAGTRARLPRRRNPVADAEGISDAASKILAGA